MSKPRMCSNCRAFVDPGERVCPYCGAELTARRQSRVDAGTALGGLIPQTHFTTLIILAVNFGLFIAMMILSQKLGDSSLFGIDSRVADVFGAKERLAIVLGGQWWRLVTAGLLHAGVIHILMNSWVLFDLGAQAEDTFGTQRYLVIFFASSAFGFYASLLWTPALSMGASAGLCGLIGAMMAYAKRSGQSMIWSFYMRWIIMIALLGLIIPVIDNAAHFGGFAAGFVLGYLSGTPGANRDEETLWGAAATATVVMVAACVFMQYRILAQALAGLS